MSIALVTGGNRGIGLEVCRQLARNGHEVILGSRDVAKGRAVAGGLRVVELDVADDSSVRRAAGEIGALDVLVNNAAILYDTWARAETADLDEVHTALETNLFGAWRTTQAFLPHLRRSAHSRVVNVSSESGSLGGMSGGTPAYSVSKAGLNALTRLLAAELRPHGILVNAICPGWTDTDMGQGGRPVEQGAASVVWAVELPDDGPTGGFFRDGRPLEW
ncbi:SDR family NAD(P)-dependent oxidoreductase [Solirubrobacter ginsenosidimutans]|uniref:SDR family NAD(P)-dependent oxidoreductase n=1 Tax=Solirubrobacter ginsenosidimutans TaxID=490573 RepID=A0A9X3MMW1_9ACTN|nr:SDR family NAD(P)-dependent oxidoreductase [Solirubrobacter ginsenosidimutans]MDA0159531.1 SDR family NAD(P)-dependent oxidoreductase [Solirubrobacter ginsenosidimutans]